MTSMSPSSTSAFAPAATALLKPLPAFAPFLVLSAAHLMFQWQHLSDAANFSKWLLMPALLVAVIAATPARRSSATALLLGAITLSWLGDITPLYANDFFFVLGLSFFLLAHVAYLLLFVRGLGYARPRAWALVYLLWWLAFVALLGPSLGGLLLPVALYGLVLGAMAAAASRGTAALACGGALFLISDTLLGSNKFLDALDLWQSGFLIMATYLAGQGLIAWGVVSLQLRESRAVSTRPPASSPPEAV